MSTGPAKLETDSRTRLLVDMTLDIDPAATTIEVKVGDTWYPATWQGSAVAKNGTWTQTAQTTGYFAGPDFASPGAAVVLAVGRHKTKTRVTSGQDVLAHDSTPVDVG